jgi:hypothetical protein
MVRVTTEELVEQLAMALKAAEWASRFNGGDACPECVAVRYLGEQHTATCLINNALVAYENWKAAQ